MINPTIGRVLLFWPEAASELTHDSKQPLPALVTYVHSPTLVNIGGFDANGKPFARTSVRLVQPAEELPSYGGYCTWMPYQVGQAAKSEELRQQLDAAKA